MKAIHCTGYTNLDFLIVNFWIMSSCSQVVVCHHYRATNYLHSQGRSENDGTYTFKTL